ncbi:MAG TPA: hypothetical protein PKY12_04870 [Catalimonadaceae bacterium]|nr:hypothetical protein [Catalimonadaceae bacterium]
MEWKIWRSTSPEEKNDNLWQLYSWHKRKSNYEKCLVSLTRIDNEVWKRQEGKSNLEIQKGLILFLRGNRQAAMQQMLLMENASLGTEDKKVLYFILIQSFLDQGDYLVSKNKLAKLTQEINLDPIKRDAILSNYDSLCQLALGVPQKSITKARRLSLFLPSAGLFYSGNPGTAVKNLGLQVAATGYLVYNVLSQNYFTAATVNLHLLRLFYIGGVNQSGALVAKANLARTLDIRSKLSQFLAKTIKTL